MLDKVCVTCYRICWEWYIIGFLSGFVIGFIIFG